VYAARPSKVVGICLKRGLAAAAVAARDLRRALTPFKQHHVSASFEESVAHDGLTRSSGAARIARDAVARSFIDRV
jgi:hypothetical protein